MYRNQHQSWLLLPVMLALGVTASFAQDDNTGGSVMSYEQKLATCASCHGESGNSPIVPSYPRLGGQYESYLQHALESYRAGRRDNLIMTQQIQVLNLTDDDIERMAAYYSSQDGLLQIDE